MTERIAEALIMHYFALTEKLDNVVYVGIVRKAKNVVVGYARLLLCYYHVFAMFALSVALRHHLSQRARLFVCSAELYHRLSLWESCQR